jgi:peptidyl-tRNA hydrolase, PTH1 family
MRIIAGLGNPGEKYRYNRHNVGRLVVNEIFTTRSSTGDSPKWVNFNGVWICKFEKMVLAKAGENFFMNESGIWLRRISEFFKVDNESIDVVYDDLDLELGRIMISNKGPKIHNGVNSVIAHLGDGFRHVRCGVDDRLGDRSIPGAEYVLRDFADTEEMSTLVSKAAILILQ